MRTGAENGQLDAFGKGGEGKKEKEKEIGCWIVLELSRRRTSIKALSITARCGIGQVDAAVQPLQGIRTHEGIMH